MNIFNIENFGALLGVAYALTILTVAGCAQRASEIKPITVSPTKYESLSCVEVEDQRKKIKSSIDRLTGQVNDLAVHDEIRVVVGAVLLSPQAFFVNGDSPEAFEYSRLLGQYRALQITAAARCTSPNEE